MVTVKGEKRPIKVESDGKKVIVHAQLDDKLADLEAGKQHLLRIIPPKGNAQKLEEFYETARKRLAKAGMDEKELAEREGYYLIKHYDQLMRDAQKTA